MNLADAEPGGVALAMAWWLAGLWGFFGGIGIEAAEIYASIRRTNHYPWKVDGEARLGLLLLSVAIRSGLGFGLAVAAAETRQISGPVGAIAVGVAAPFIFEQFKSFRLPKSDDVYKSAPALPQIRPPSPRKKASPKKAESGSRDGI